MTAFGNCLGGLLVCLRIFKVIIVQRDLAGRHACGFAPVKDVVISPPVFRLFEMKVEFRFSRCRLVRADAVSQHHFQLLTVLNEVVINTFFFHQTANKVEIRFGVLDTINPAFVASGGLFFNVGPKAVIFQNLLNNIHNGFVLKNSVFLPPCQKPKPRPRFRNKMRQALIQPDIFHRRARPGKIAVLIVSILDTKGNDLSKNILKIKRIVGRQELDRCFRQKTKAFNDPRIF